MSFKNLIMHSFIAALILSNISVVSANIHLEDPIYKAGSTVDYLIIAPNDSGILSQAKRLADLKWERGLQTRIVTIDSINTRIAGTDIQEKIRTCIQSYYADSGLTWLLLFGDYHLVPARRVTNSDGYQGIVSDIYYACLDGAWDTDNDGVFGEEPARITYQLKCRFDTAGAYVCDRLVEHVEGLDIWPDVYVGRLPVSSVAEAKVMVDKIIAYTTEYRQTKKAQDVLLFGPRMLKSSQAPNGAWIDDVSYFLHYRIKPFLNRANSVFTNGNVLELYEDRITAGDTIINDSLDITVDSVNACLSQGRNLVIFCAHGDSNTIQLSSSVSPPRFFTTGNALSGSSELYSNMIGQSCSLMRLPADSTMCFAKSFLVNPSGGAVSFYGANSIEMVDQAWPITESVMNIISSGRSARLAQAYQFVTIDESRENQFIHQFWGDPEMELWTKSLTQSDSIGITIGRFDSAYIIQTTPLVDSALICIYRAGEMFRRGYSRMGYAVFDTLDSPIDSVRIVAIKHDYLPGRLVVNTSDIQTLGVMQQQLAVQSRLVVRKNGHQLMIRGIAGKLIQVRVFDMSGRLVSQEASIQGILQMTMRMKTVCLLNVTQDDAVQTLRISP